MYVLLYARETVVISMKEFFRILSYDLHWKKQNLQANVACCRANSVFIFSTVSVSLRQGRIRELRSKWNLLKATRSIFFSTFMSDAKLVYNSWVGRRKGGSAWITLNLWCRRSLNFWTSQSCSLSSNWFFECENPLIDKPMVIKEPAVASAWLLGLGSKLYPSNMLRMLSKDLTRFMPSWVRQYRARQQGGILGSLSEGVLDAVLNVRRFPVYLKMPWR